MKTIASRVLASMLWLAAMGVVDRSYAEDVNPKDIAAIRAEMQALKAQYSAQIGALEQRLARAETALAKAEHAVSAPVPAPVPPSNPPSVANALNPATSLVLMGNYVAHSRDPNQFSLPGFTVPSEAGPLVRGFSLGESELTLSANIDDKFYGNLTASMTVENGETTLSLEEAYFQTLTLPYGFTAKGGRFFSRIGYLNEQHPHADDFVDRPLAYRAFLNGTLGDDGLQLRWLAPTALFLEFGAEAYRGDAFPAHGAASHGVGTHTAFVHLGDDLNDSWSYRVGGSYVHAAATERATSIAPDIFNGTNELAIADAILKWAPNGNPAQINFKLQGEYLRRWENGQFNGADYTGVQDGFYLQGVYQFMPRWRVGARYDGLFADNIGLGVVGTVLDDLGHNPRRESLLLEFDNSEFSRLRLQYTRDESSRRIDHQLFLNYIYSLGAHGAHQF